MEIIHFFDINGQHKENADIDLKKLYSNIDSPIRILNKFTNRDNNTNPPKHSEDKLLVEYNFDINLANGTKKINCYIIYNFSVSHQSTLNSLGYVVFFNLENDKIDDLLGKIIDYIKDNCSLNVKTYMIGIFSNELKPDKTEKKMREFFDLEDFDYEYYQMFMGDDDSILEKYKGAGKVDTILKKVLMDIFGSDSDIKKSSVDKTANENGSKVNCSIY